MDRTETSPMTERTENRSMRLFDIGLQWNGSQFYNEDVFVHWTELTCDTDEEFDRKIAKIEKEMTRRQEVAA